MAPPPLDPSRLYRPPWTDVDNVNGWIEPTFACNLRCRACYRLDQQEVFPLEEMKEFVDRTIRIRNCDHVSIAGGEPLLVDYLDDLVNYIKHEKGRKVTVFTNGVLLDEHRLRSLRAAGLDRINLHVDSGQNRPGWEDSTEVDLLELRQRYLDLIHDSGIQCSTIAVLYENTHRYLPDLLRWAVSNSGKLSNITFDLFRYYPDPRHVESCTAPGGEPVDPRELAGVASVADERRATVQEVYEEVSRAVEGFSPHSYLNGTDLPDRIKWLLSTLILSHGEVIGFLGPRAVEFATVLHHFRKGRYPSFVGNRTSRSLFLASLFDGNVRSAFGRYLKRCLGDPTRLFRGIDLLSVAIVQPSDWYTDGTQNMCDSCPDAILHGDRLIPSCRLDEYKRYGGMVRIFFRDGIEKNHSDLNAALRTRREP